MLSHLRFPPSNEQTIFPKGKSTWPLSSNKLWLTGRHSFVKRPLSPITARRLRLLLRLLGGMAWIAAGMLVLAALTACQLPPIEPALFQPISPLAPTAVAHDPTPPTVLSDLQSYRVTWSTQMNDEHFQLNYDRVRADHTWGFDAAFQIRMPNVEMIFLEGYLIGDTAYGQMMDQPFEADPRQGLADALPFPTELILEVEPSGQAVVVPPMFMMQPPFATIIAQTAPMETVEIDGVSVARYQLAGSQALDLLGAAVQRASQAYPTLELSTVQGEFWFTADKKHVIRYAIEAEGTSNGGNRPFTLHEAYAVTDINQVPPITLPAEAQAQVAEQATTTAATLIAPWYCPSCAFPKPAGVPVTSNPMSGGRFANFQFSGETMGIEAIFADYEAQLVALGWQITDHTERQEEGWLYHTWSVTNGLYTFSISGRCDLTATPPVIAIEIVPGDPDRQSGVGRWSAASIP